MAVDWIKIRVDLLTSPKVVRMSTGLDKDRLHVIGGLFAVWSIFDAHSEDGVLDGYTPETLDKIIFFDGFSKHMESVGWLIVSENSLSVPRFDSHNGKSAKNRAMDSERKRTSRKIQNVSERQTDKNTTREEKRREEKKDICLDSSLPAIIETQPLAKARSIKKTKMPDDFILTTKRANLAILYWSNLNREDLDVRGQFAEFQNHHKQHGKTMADWDAAWVTWYTNAPKFNKAPKALGKQDLGFIERISDRSWAES
jgi:hypothetical protein